MKTTFTATVDTGSVPAKIAHNAIMKYLSAAFGDGTVEIGSLQQHTSEQVDAPLIGYTDGGYQASKNKGSWAYAVTCGDEILHSASAAVHDTTNNRMEIQAAIALLEALPIGTTIEVHSDSQYVVKSMTLWVNSWIKNNWYSASTGKPVLNADLIAHLHLLTQMHTVTWQWVKGHAGNKFNEHVDQLCTQAMNE